MYVVIGTDKKNIAYIVMMYDRINIFMLEKNTNHENLVEKGSKLIKLLNKHGKTSWKLTQGKI